MNATHRPYQKALILGALMPVPGSNALNRQIHLEQGAADRKGLTSFFAAGHFIASYLLVQTMGCAIFSMLAG